MKLLLEIVTFGLLLGLCLSRQYDFEENDDEESVAEFEPYPSEDHHNREKYHQWDRENVGDKKWDKVEQKYGKNAQKKQPWKMRRPEQEEGRWHEEHDQDQDQTEKWRNQKWGREQPFENQDDHEPHHKQGNKQMPNYPSSGYHQQQQQQQNNENLLYNYEVRTKTGSANVPQQSGLKIQAKILFNRLSGSTCVLKIQDPTASKFVGSANQQNEKESSSSNFFRINLESKQSKLLSLPVKFGCQNGLVKRPMFDEGDEPWSMNLKRGVLNMFHVNTKHMADQQSPSSAKHFQVYEESVEGECQTDYSFMPVRSTIDHDEQQNNQMFNITKSVNFQNCKERPHVFYDFPSAAECLSGHESKRTSVDDHLIHSSSTSSYSISGNVYQFAIREAKTTSQYIYAPFGQKSDQIVAEVFQELKLVWSNANQKIEEPKVAQLSESGMLYSLEWDVARERATIFGQVEHLNKLNADHAFTDISNKVLTFIKELKSMANTASKQGKPPKKTTQLINAMIVLQQANQQDLQQIENQLNKEQESSRDKKSSKADSLYVQLLGICGTKICIKRLLQLIQQRQISPVASIVALQELFNVQIPSEDIIQEILSMASQMEQSGGRQEGSYFLKQTLWLLSGSLINSLCSNSLHKLAIEQHQSKSACPSHLKHQFVQIIARQLRQSQKWEEKLIFTKTLANAGLTESLPLLEKLIKNKNKDASWVRNSAIFALRKLARTRSGYIQGLLLPIVTNSKEPTEIRLSAAKLLLESDPDLSILNQLATVASKDQDEQLSHAIHAALNTIANSSKICDQPLIRNAKLAAQQYKPKSNKPKCSESSTLKWASIVDKEKEQSLDFEMFVSYGNQSSSFNPLPKHVSLGFNLLQAGLYVKNLAAVGLVTTDPEKTLDKAYQSILDAEKLNPFHGDVDGGKVGHYLHEIWSRGLRHFSEHEDDQNDEQSETSEPAAEYSHGHRGHDSFKALIYAQSKGQNVGFLPINKNLMSRYLSTLGFEIRRLKREMAEGQQMTITGVSVARNTLIKIPTSSGFPLSIALQIPTIFNFNGKVQFGGAAGSQSQSTGSAKNKVNLNVKLELESKFILDTQIWSPIINHGFKVEKRARLHVPFTGSAEVDLSQGAKNVRLQIAPSAPLVNEYVNIKQKPVTYANRWTDFVKDFNNVDEKPIGLKPSDVTKTCYPEFLSGSNICVTKTKRSPSLMLNSLKPGYLSITCESKPTMMKPQPLEITATTIGSSAKRHLPYHDESTIVNKIHVTAKSGQRKSSINVAYVIDPTQKASRMHAVLSSQNDNSPMQMMCFDYELLTLDSKQKLFVGNAGLKWGRGSCESAKYFIDMELKSNRQNEAEFSTYQRRPLQGQCTKEKCYLNTEEDEAGQQQAQGKNKIYKLVVNYNAPVEVKNLTNKAYQVFKHNLYGKSDVAQIDVKNPPNRIFAVLQISADGNPIGNLLVKSPNENLTVSDMRLPSIFGPSLVPCNQHKQNNEKPHQKNTRKTPFGASAEKMQEKPEQYPFDQEEEEETVPFDQEESDEDQYPDEVDHEEESLFEEDPNESIDLEHHRQYKRQIPNNPFILKHRKNGLVEGPDWLSGGGSQDEREDPLYNDEDEKKDKKKPNWGDWLKENKEGEADESNSKHEKGREDLYKDKQISQCRLDKNDQITTIGNQKYKFPIHQCFAILSKDCTPNRRFIIMVKRLDEQRDKLKKELFILLRTHKISLHRVDNQARAKVNDVPMELRDDKEMYAPGSKYIKLQKKGSQVIVDIQELGIRLQFDGYNVEIQFSDKIAKQQCGLCGLPNNKNWPDTSKPNFEKQIHEAFVVKDPNCKKSSENEQQPFGYQRDESLLPSQRIDPAQDASSMHHKDDFTVRKPHQEDNLWKKHDQQSGYQDFDKFGEEGEPSSKDFRGPKKHHQSNNKPTKAHSIVETNDRICISITAIPKCQGRSHAEHEQEKRVPFICMNNREKKAQQMKRKAKANEPIPELENLEPNQFFTVLIPLNCAKY